MKISVAMCTYNGARYLQEQLDSIARQTRPPDELVVCDDDSTDDTNEIITSFAGSASFPVSHHVNERNLGSTRNFENAIQLCQGDIIALSDQDDVWRPDKLALVEKCFAENPKVGMVFSDAEIVDEQLRSLGRLSNVSGFDKKKQRLIREGKALDVLLPAWWVTGATMAFQSKFTDLVSPIPTDIPMIHDGWISLMIAAVAEVSFIEDPLILYRQHDRQQLGAPTKRSDEGEKSKRKLLATLKSPPRHDSYSDLVRSLNAIYERQLLKGKTVGDCISPVENRLKHLKARANLPVHALSRLLLVLRELLTMRYHRYSNGIFSAARDLLHPATDHNPARDAP
jgi:glycosyltransferase involved in cell wall biosynthesis